MILSEELSATLDEPTDCVMMHRVEPSRLQLLALNLSERLHSLQENAEQVGRLALFSGFVELQNVEQSCRMSPNRSCGGY